MFPASSKLNLTIFKSFQALKVVMTTREATNEQHMNKADKRPKRVPSKLLGLKRS